MLQFDFLDPQRFLHTTVTCPSYMSFDQDRNYDNNIILHLDVKEIYSYANTGSDHSSLFALHYSQTIIRNS